MNVALTISMIALGISLLSFAVTVTVSMRIQRLEHEVDRLRVNVAGLPEFPDLLDRDNLDTPAFLKRQAD